MYDLIIIALSIALMGAGAVVLLISVLAAMSAEDIAFIHELHRGKVEAVAITFAVGAGILFVDSAMRLARLIFS
jgi:hypothetical protein